MKFIITVYILIFAVSVGFGQSMKVRVYSLNNPDQTQDSLTFVYNGGQPSTMTVVHGEIDTLRFADQGSGTGLTLDSVSIYNTTYSSTEVTDTSAVVKIGTIDAGTNYSLILHYSSGPTQFTFSCGLTILDETAGINDPTKEDVQLNVFPNPCLNQITISNYQLPIELYKLNGQAMTISDIVFVTSNEAKINMSTFIPGLYFLKSGTTLLKIIKQ